MHICVVLFSRATSDTCGTTSSPNLSTELPPLPVIARDIRAMSSPVLSSLPPVPESARTPPMTTLTEEQNTEAAPGESHHRTDSNESFASSQDTRRQAHAIAHPLCQTIARALMSPEHVELIGRLSETLGEHEQLPLDDMARDSSIAEMLSVDGQYDVSNEANSLSTLEVNLGDGEELSLCKPWDFYQLRHKVGLPQPFFSPVRCHLLLLGTWS